MIKFNSYGHKVMMDYFEKTFIVCIIIATIAYLMQNVVGVILCIILILYLAAVIFDSLNKMTDPQSIFKNCWWDPDKEG